MYYLNTFVLTLLMDHYIFTLFSHNLPLNDIFCHTFCFIVIFSLIIIFSYVDRELARVGVLRFSDLQHVSSYVDDTVVF